MDVESSSIQENAFDNDNRERCEKRKRIDDFSDPNERDMKKFCNEVQLVNEVQSMVISETSNVGFNSNGFISTSFPGNSFQPNSPYPSNLGFVSNNYSSSNYSNYSVNNFPSHNYPSPLPVHFLHSANNSSNNYPSNNNLSNTNYQMKAESISIDSPNENMYLSSIVIFVRTLTGRIVEIEANPQDTVLGLKERIQMRDGIPPSNQRLVFQGKAISDSQILQVIGIRHRSTVHLVLGLTG